ncbi:MAG: heme lyase CcmF/NrfE family subunit [Acidimicrobiia bacterium]|nr:heme lyase CcmF/NrfE family subunit [Acidimicrobiia bacterium]
MLGLGASVFGAVAIVVGLVQGRPALRRTSWWYAAFTFGGAAVAFVAMERALITRDFSVAYVARNGSSRTPPLYNFATLWAALEGSILLWAFVLSGYLIATVRKFRARLSDPLVGWALLTMFVVAAFFFALMATAANPFEHFAAPAGYDGPGPNPLLQNHPLMVIHPPVLYLGYVGFTVPFAFAVAALATGRLGEGWLVATRRWTLIAWGFLTLGIMLGAWWSYEVLGWGGYWAWDPVENASFLPWLTGTAYLHSVMVQERRGMLRVWNLSLVCATFALTILGTFLTRSGVLESVHAFSDSLIGPLLLAFFGVIVAVTCGLVAWRGPMLRSPGRIDAVRSREAAFLVNNLLFAAFAFVVLLGTVFPLIVESLNGERLTVGEPFFDTMAMPIGLALLFLMAVAPVLPWRKASTETLAERLHWPAWAGVAALVLSVVVGARGLAPLLGFTLGGFAAGAALRQVVLATRRQGWRGLVGRTNGGMIVHLGVILVGVALTASQSYSSERRVTLTEGESAVVSGHTVELVGIETEELEAHTETRALVRIDGGQVYAPAVQRFGNGTSTIGTPSVRTGLTEDVYLALLSDPEGGEVELRVIVQPLIVWLWTGGGLMFFGTFLAAFPGRRRDPLDPTSAPVPVEGTEVPDPEPEPALVGAEP